MAAIFHGGYFTWGSYFMAAIIHGGHISRQPYSTAVILHGGHNTPKQGCLLRLVTLDALQCTENFVSQIDR